MTTIVDGTSGVSLVQDGVVVTADIVDANVTQAKLAANVVGKGPMLSVWQNVAQSVGSGSGNTILFDQEEYDTANAYNPATGFFAPQVAGFYLVTARWQAVAGTYALTLQLGKNGALLRYLDTCPAAGVGDVAGSAIVYMNGTTDYLHIIGSSTTSQNTSPGQAITWMQATLVRAA
jgi:hypothetical protein